MKRVLTEILRKNNYFKEKCDNVFIPEFLPLIINGVVVYNFNYILISDDELIFMDEEDPNHPVASITLEHLNSLLISTKEGIKEVL